MISATACQALMKTSKLGVDFVSSSKKVLTFNESKQAITLPLSTWQLLGGWANLHSSSLREQVPL